MVELSPFRTVVDLRGPAIFGILSCPRIDATIEGANEDWPSCDDQNWSGGWYIINTLVSAGHFWVGNASFSSPVGGRLANDALPDISTPLSWPAGAFSYRIQQAPAFPPINGYAGRWAPLTTPEVDPERYPGYKQGSSIELRYWGHSAGGPTECIVASQRPLIVESGRLAIVNPPETRADLTQYPGALTLAFGPIAHNGVTFVPVGIWARYVTNSFDTTWLGGQPPILSVLYQADRS